MNWEALSAISDIVGAGAILVTLIYLAVQMRQNTATVQASTRQAILQEDQALGYRVLDEPEILLLRYKPELTDEEKIRLSMYLTTFFRLRESNWRQYRNGVLDEATWNSYKGSIRAFASASVRTWSDHPMVAQTIDPEFLSMVKEFLAACPDSDRPPWLDTIE
jgi:hypothetical protein